MTIPFQDAPDALVSVRAAADWLRRRGVKPHTPHAVMVAIAKGSLKVAAFAKRQMFLREVDLESFAEQQKAASRRETASR